MATKKLLNIDIVSDIMCPWCWVGKRKLEEAMKKSAEKYDFVVRWHPFVLRPGIPLEGSPKGDATPQGREHLQSAGKLVGLDFTFKCPNYPNTLPAHCLLGYALKVDGGKHQNDVQEAIFKAYFTDGIYPDAKALTKIAKEVGLDEKEVKKFVTDPEKHQAASEEARNWARKGVTGVPCFFINGQRTFSGAQDVENFLKVFEVISEKYPAESTNSSI